MSLDSNDNKYQTLMDLINSHQFDGIKELELLNEMKEELINQKSSGRKVIKTICGQKYKISKKHLPKLEKICKLIQSKEYALNNIDSSEWSKKVTYKLKFENTNHDKLVFDKLLRNLKEKEPLIKKSPILKKQYQDLKYHLIDSYVDISEKCDLIRKFISENTVAFNFLVGSKNNKKGLVEAVSDMNVDDLQGYERVIKKEVVDEPKPQKKKTPKIFRRIIAGFSAFLMIGICSVVAKSNNNSNKSDDTYAEIETAIATSSTETSQTTMSKVSSTKDVKINTKTLTKVRNKKGKVKTINSKAKKQTKPLIKKIKINKDKFQLGSKFKVKNNSPIYSNVNNANSKVNGQKAYYDNNVVRKSIGLSIEYNKNTITFIEVNKNQYKVLGLRTNNYLDTKEANQEITNLLKKGGEIKSLLSQNNNTYEGYYNKDDVKVLVKK